MEIMYFEQEDVICTSGIGDIDLDDNELPIISPHGKTFENTFTNK